jgi:hypothetical protein
MTNNWPSEDSEPGYDRPSWERGYDLGREKGYARGFRDGSRLRRQTRPWITAAFVVWWLASGLGLELYRVNWFRAHGCDGTLEIKTTMIVLWPVVYGGVAVAAVATWLTGGEVAETTHCRETKG